MTGPRTAARARLTVRKWPTTPSIGRSVITSPAPPNLLAGGSTFQATGEVYTVPYPVEPGDPAEAETLVSGVGETWASSNAAVFTVHATTGVITPVGAGTATLRFIVPGIVDATQAVTVSSPIATLDHIDLSTLTLAGAPGGTGVLSAFPRDASNGFIGGVTGILWESETPANVSAGADSGNDSHQSIISYVAVGTGRVRAYKGAVFSPWCTGTVATPTGIVYFDDDFASGDFSKNMGGFRWGGRNAGSGDALPVVTTTKPYPAKTYSCQFQFGGNPVQSDDAWSELGIVFGTPLTEYYLRFWLYYPSAADSGLGTAAYDERDIVGPFNNKLWTSWSGAYSPSASYTGCETRSKISGVETRLWSKYKRWLSATGPSEGGQNGLPSYVPWVKSDTDLGQWMKFQFHFKSSITWDGGTGVIQVWKNDVLVQNHQGLNMGALDPALAGHTQGYILGWFNCGFNETTRVWLGPTKMASDYITD